MSLIQEFKYQAKVLENADFQVIAGQVEQWLEDKGMI
jgi:hypothetical protein